VKEEEIFLANYVDGLTDMDLNRVIGHFRQSKRIACFVSVPPTQSFHLVGMDESYCVTRIDSARSSNLWMNGGYFAFSNRIFDFIRPGEDLVNEPFQRLIRSRELITMKHEGFWACMDTFKERQQLEDLWATGAAPWQVWRKNGHISEAARNQRPQHADAPSDPALPSCLEHVSRDSGQLESATNVPTH
jgi:glucose-1-phosphate cytidylyltransferase